MAANITTIRIELSEDERVELERWARSLAAPHRTVVRAKTILLLADGETVSSVSRQVGRQRRHVRKWAHRFMRKRLRGLDDDPRSGRPPAFSPRDRHVPGEAGVRAA
jgi:DNA-directed RNA polymerase sigma subunit (sigma70/sigma32)